MDYKVIWTDEAIEDLRKLTARIAADNPTAALNFGEMIIRRSMVLGPFPRLGRMVREPKRDTLREIVIRPYRLIYEIDDQRATVKVWLLWHESRDEPDTLPAL